LGIKIYFVLSNGIKANLTFELKVFMYFCKS